ncbi:MAG: DUF3474 domain-containing protein [Leptospiraceae bacterium]|nr:DUF3474 domain-containing protein [Leptospiraceae bacterium]
MSAATIAKVRPEASEEQAHRTADPAPSADPPFTLQQLKASIPAECFQPIVWKSLLFFGVDVAIIAGLYSTAALVDSWFFWPVFWLMQGTMFWALFVVGHDCGHGSFSHNRRLNSLIGHLSHSPLLVPYHGWRISHRIHHQTTGHVEDEETWYPLTESEYRNRPLHIRMMRFTPIMLWLFPFYLLRRSPRKHGSHFLPSSDLFRPSEKWDVIVSSIWWLACAALLGWFTYEQGFMALLKYYLGPYIVFIAWLDLVTFLHHNEASLPWYRGEKWSFMKGAISSIDRDYGFINDIHHNIGTHVVHHLFIAIPHYHLKQATQAIRPVLGDYYNYSETGILKSFVRSLKACQYVRDTGDVVYYHRD